MKSQAAIIGGIALVLIVLQYCENRALRDQMDELMVQSRGFTERIDNLGRQTVEQPVAEVTWREMKRIAPKAKTAVQIVREIEHDTIYIKTQIPIDTTVEFTYEEPFTEIEGIVHKQGVTLTKVSIQDSLKITTRTERQGLFKRSVEIIEVENLNPNVRVKGLSSYKRKKKRGLWKPIAAGIVGIVVGWRASKSRE